MSSSFFKDIEKRYVTYERAYRELVAGSNAALNAAKRAIFALHRGDAKGGAVLVAESERILTGFEPLFKKEPLLRSEGAYRAGVEEFVEANLFAQFLDRKPLGRLAGLGEVDAELYLGGLSDLTGELVRYAMSRATAHDDKEVRRAKETLDAVMEFLIGLDLTGYLRTKFDQAKNSARRMDEIMYDRSLRK